MTNVESMDYTHSHPSTFASLSNTAHFSPVSYTHHIPSLKQPPYLPIMAFLRLFRDIFPCNFHHFCFDDLIIHCHIALHDHIAHIVVVAQPPFIIFHTCYARSFHILVHCQRHSYRVILCYRYRVVSK